MGTVGSAARIVFQVVGAAPIVFLNLVLILDIICIIDFMFYSL